MSKYKEVDNEFIDRYKDNFNLLIVTATPTERDEVNSKLKPLPGQEKLLEIQKSKYTYYIGVFGAYFAVHTSCNEMGSVGRSASLTTTIDAINFWYPKVLLMVGIAFGFDKTKQKIGDILVAERILPYEPERVGDRTSIPRGKEGPASSMLVDRFRSVDGWEYKNEEGEAPKIEYGIVFTGEKLVDNIEFRDAILKQRVEAIGGEMEGAGIYAACDNKDTRWILVKGICDYADGRKKTKKKLKQAQAIKSAVSLSEFVFNKSASFKDAGLVVQDIILNVDFTQDNGAIPDWMKKHAQSLAKEIRHEDQ